MRKPKSRGAITLRIALAMLILWGTAMYWTTQKMAQRYAEIAEMDGEQYAEEIGRSVWLDYIYTEGSEVLQNRDPEILSWKDYDMLRALAAVSNPQVPEDEFWLHMQEYYGEEVAAVFCDKDGNILYECGDFMVFPMHSKEGWEKFLDGADNLGTGVINLGPLSGNEMIANYLREAEYKDTFAWLRITGCVDGVQVTPVKFEYVTHYQVDQVIESGSSLRESLPWTTLFDKTAEAEPEGLTTFYTGVPIFSLYHEGRTLITSGMDEYRTEDEDTLKNLLADMAKDVLRKGEIYNYAFSMRTDEVIVFDRRYYALDGSGDKSYNPNADFILVTASAYRPMGMAMGMLLSVYQGTMLFGIVLVLILSWSVNRNLIWHVRRVNQLISEGWPAAEFGDLEPWEEAAQLQRNYHKTVGLRQKDKNEIARLETALSYAKEAEDNRRQMVSAIAHELKTPLAVVHSYAEGLQEKIAEEKREQYLQTILTETERMDGMVMEMLDLSRLEAGKVKLARDRFDLGEMVKDTFEKLQPMAEEKKLLIQLQLKENCMVNADDGRIAQAVMNLASNAVRYTPVGGNITVTLGLVWRQTVLTVANDCENFTEEELEKVWESFYRRDKSRDRKGTGLGLAITRQIVQLHSGSCYVKNTDTGVEFGIKLPN